MSELMSNRSHKDSSSTFAVSGCKYTGRQAAMMIGVTPETITRWRKRKIVPSRLVKLGRVDVFMYTDHDLDLMHRISRITKPGRGNKVEDINLRKIRKVSRRRVYKLG